jgi:hypothetical protein
LPDEPLANNHNRSPGGRGKDRIVKVDQIEGARVPFIPLAEWVWRFLHRESNVNDLKAYIAGQKEHHETSTFQDEYRKILRKYKIEFDERYVWD